MLICVSRCPFVSTAVRLTHSRRLLSVLSTLVQSMDLDVVADPVGGLVCPNRGLHGTETNDHETPLNISGYKRLLAVSSSRNQFPDNARLSYTRQLLLQPVAIESKLAVIKPKLIQDRRVPVFYTDFVVGS